MPGRGYQVGLLDLPVKAPLDGKGYILPGGTLLWAKEERYDNDRRNKIRIAELHGAQLPAIQAAVSRANQTLRSRWIESGPRQVPSTVA